ncbi:MAG TPA: cytochrome c peroxidase [Kofleriaceae bacterium]|nr:cytochrome c peroxidase [Kofleriaceae bacterium]
MIHDAFTPEQWAHLQEQFAPPQVDSQHLCTFAFKVADCVEAVRLGQQLFFEPRLSGGAGVTTCATCHAASLGNGNAAWYTDIRSLNAVSQGAMNPTPHNTLTVVNIGLSERTSYGWTGVCDDRPCQTVSDIIDKIALPKAMASTPAIVANVIRSTPSYLTSYERAFGYAVQADDAQVQTHVEVLFEAYMRHLVSINAPFDDFIRGDNNDAISPAAKRGFALFVGRAMCAECHYGGMFMDDSFHVTGVQDAGFDGGLNGTGAFYTPSLRNVEKTAPYMHKGTKMGLGDVIDFYHWGGDKLGYTGDKDPLVQPFDITPDEGKDLEAFLRALTGQPISDELRKDTHVVMHDRDLCFVNEAAAGMWCGSTCISPGSDPNNCGDCGTKCDKDQVCMGTCVP